MHRLFIINKCSHKIVLMEPNHAYADCYLHTDSTILQYNVFNNRIVFNNTTVFLQSTLDGRPN